MIRELSITALVENTAGRTDCLGEWGLALWIEADQFRILSDTGQGRTLLDNARLLGVELKNADALVISHGHSDHTGGIAALVASGFRGRVYAHPAALAKKYHREENSPPKAKGIPLECEQALRSPSIKLIDSSAPTEIAPGLRLTGAIPRQTEFEKSSGDSFFLDEECTQPDSFVDDQALLIETPRGWVVVTGCCHSGLINTLHYVAKLTGNSRIYALVGGLHLFRASQERILATAEQLKKFGLRVLVPCHCTGFEATGILQTQFGNQVMGLRAGLKLKL